MRKTPELAWEAIYDYYIKHNKDSLAGIKFAVMSKGQFVQDFIKIYKQIIDNYMNDSVKELDRHKQAAILLYCTIKNRLFIPAIKPKKNEVFVGCEQIGLLLSLSYMKDMLNEVLKEINEKPIERYILPQAFSCSTEYFDILTRDLYLQEHEDDGVYVLFLAHVLFLIEYNTLKEIDANIIRKLKDYTKSEQC